MHPVIGFSADSLMLSSSSEWTGAFPIGAVKYTLLELGLGPPRIRVVVVFRLYFCMFLKCAEQGFCDELLVPYEV
jgi:hypothetical protein